MGYRWIREHMKAIYLRYGKAHRQEKKEILDEFCRTHRCHRKHAIRLFNSPLPETTMSQRRRPPRYPPSVISILQAIWEAAGYLWSRRLKAALPLWIPWARRRFQLTPQQERLLLAISPAQIDRRLAKIKRKLKRRIYDRTKPGSLLKHHIPIKTDSWNVRRPGFMEADLVSHSGPSEDGVFANTLDMTDIHTTWVERRAVLGKGQQAVQEAVDDVEKELPFPLRGFDSDNGSEFINHHLHAYCKKRRIQFTRGRPYKKDDNAHVEQKNWTHVRQLFGYVRYDTPEAVEAINELYRNELRYFQNFFQPSVTLLRKIRIGSKIKRLYRPPQTPFDRVLRSKGVRPQKVAALKKLRAQLDPFELSQAIDRKLKAIYRLAEKRGIPKHQKEISKASTPILVRPTKAQQLQWEGFVKKGPALPLFDDVRFDPVFQLRQRLEREAAMPK